MAVVEKAPEGLEELLAQLLLFYDIEDVAPPERPAIKRPGQPGRRCRCDRPIRMPDDRDPSWVRDLKCGRDV
jgi:hypothetical protein